MEFNVQVASFAGCPLAVVRRRASRAELPKVVPQACGTVWSTLRATNATGMGRNVAVYLDDEINLEVGVEIGRQYVAGTGEVIASSLPAGTVASTAHFGPYSELRAAHDAVLAWVRNNRDYRLAGPGWELYGHWQEEWNHDPSKIRTDVYYLLAPAAKAR